MRRVRKECQCDPTGHKNETSEFRGAAKQRLGAEREENRRFVIHETDTKNPEALPVFLDKFAHIQVVLTSIHTSDRTTTDAKCCKHTTLTTSGFVDSFLRCRFADAAGL